jgi:hypothetical protein
MPHPFKKLQLNYFYVLTLANKKTVIIDGVSHEEAVASAGFRGLNCKPSERTYSSFLLKKDRSLIIWSDSPKIPKVKFVIKKDEPLEPHKHPYQLNQPIKKGEKFSWYTYTQYIWQIPSKERIDLIRKKYGWYSKDKPLWRFYHSGKAVKYDSLSFYMPKWLSQYEYSRTYLDNVDSKPLNEIELEKDGFYLERMRSFNRDPRDELREVIPNFPFSASHWRRDYFQTKVVFRCQKATPKIKRLKVTVGLLMPERKKWVFEEL